MDWKCSLIYFLDIVPWNNVAILSSFRRTNIDMFDWVVWFEYSSQAGLSTKIYTIAVLFKSTEIIYQSWLSQRRSAFFHIEASRYLLISRDESTTMSLSCINRKSSNKWRRNLILRCSCRVMINVWKIQKHLVLMITLSHQTKWSMEAERQSRKSDQPQALWCRQRCISSPSKTDLK